MLMALYRDQAGETAILGFPHTAELEQVLKTVRGKGWEPLEVVEGDYPKGHPKRVRWSKAEVD